MAKSSIPSLVTYDTDVAQSIAGYQGTVISELLSEAREREKQEKVASPTNPKNVFYIVASIVLVLGGIAAVSYGFIPQIPQADTITPCNGLGMGFNLFKIDMFKDPKIPNPWFQTLQEHIPGIGSRVYTQDLFFFENAGKAGYKFACDTRIKVGHLDPSTDVVW